MLKGVLILILVAAMSCSRLHKMSLDKWQFQVKDHFKDEFYQAHIPSTIHLDLMEHKLIDDPFYKTQVNNVSWLANADVVYHTTFQMPDNLDNEYTELVFEGIDTYSTVILNGKEILTTNNAFVKYTLPIQYRPGNNTLEVRFRQSPSSDEKQQASVERLPFAYGHTRKPAYQHGWDWAPNLVTVGIWKPVYILCNSPVRLDYVWIRNKVVSPSEAILNVAVVLKSQDSVLDYDIAVLIDNKEVVRHSVASSVVYFDVPIKNPKYWWPRNVGTPNVYNFKFKLLDKKGNEIDEFNQVYGIRTTELNTTDGAFQFIINGHPVYAKGANYVPPDMFYPRFINKAFKAGYTLQQYMQTIQQSNYNMIRVWGGGQYQSDEFYEECTKRGIMVFQDFMFSVNIYPGHEKFLRNCELELKQQIRRMRNYACIVLWSGNNEILQGIQEWGWGSELYRKNYNLLFEKLLRKILQIESPDISYIPSSPQFGSGYAGRTGDIHSWAVWAGGSLFNNYEQFIGRFNSEFGTQAFPVYQTVLSFVGADDLKYESNVLLFHEKHTSQFNTLQSYIHTYMNKSVDFEMEIYQSSLVQAYGVGVAIQAHRIKRPECWGTLYWQYNDAWPGISWASMDYYGRWKALQYSAKRLYMDVAVMFKGNTEVAATIVNDKLYDVECLLTLKVLTTQGKELFNESRKVTVGTNKALQVMKFDNKKITELSGGNTQNLVFFGEVVSSKNNIMRNTHYTVYPKDLVLPKAKIIVKYDTQTNEIKVRSNVLVKNLFIDLKQGKYVKLSDNYFDLVPGYPETIKIDGQLSQLKHRLRFKSYRQSYSGDTMDVQIES